MKATDESVEGFQPVNEIVLEQKIQRPVDGWRRRPGLLGLELVEQIVGLDRPVGGQYQLKHAPTRRCQPQPTLAAMLFNFTDNLFGLHGCYSSRAGGG
jgi:hypothetical protein